jgi:hypothetical protein
MRWIDLKSTATRLAQTGGVEHAAFWQSVEEATEERRERTTGMKDKQE